MAETYCGKSCANCALKEQLKCPGCKTGPGRAVHGDCKLAACCRGRNYQECTACGTYDTCHSRRDAYNIPGYRLKSIQEAEERAADLVRRAPRLSKWLSVLFWLNVPLFVVGFLEYSAGYLGINDAASSIFTIVSLACNLIYCISFFVLAAEEDRYRTAGICGLINIAISIFLTWNSSQSNGTSVIGSNFGSVLLLAIPAAIIGLVGKYNECTAHSIVLTGLNNILADKWEKLWKWYFGTYLALIGSIFLLILSVALGLLALVVSAIALVVISIIWLVYLYKTAKLFRDIVC